MIILIQSNLFKEFNQERLIETLERFQIEYILFKIYNNSFYEPFENDEDVKKPLFLNHWKRYFIFGSVKAANIGFDLYPGSLMNANHDYKVYSKYYETLNSDCHFINFSDELPKELPEAFFARPTKDTKSFSGQLFTKDAWNNYVAEVLSNKNQSRLTAETEVLVAPLKVIYKEVRCFVVDGKVVTASIYKINNFVVYSDLLVDQDIIDFAEEQIKKFKVASAFVIDIADTDKGLKVVEVNCINSSGFYKCDIQKIILALFNTFAPKYFDSPSIDY